VFSIPVNEYTWATYQAILYDPKGYDPNMILEPLYNDVFKGEKTFYFGMIKFDAGRSTIITKEEGEFNYIEEEDKLNMFIRRIYDRLTKYHFLGIYTERTYNGASPHANFILMYMNGKIIPQTTVMLYDPLGYESRDFSQPLIDAIIGSYEKYGVITEIKDIDYCPANFISANPMGIQTVSYDKTGFCVMFSYLWMYIFMTYLKVIGFDNLVKYPKNIKDLIQTLEKGMKKSSVVDVEYDEEKGDIGTKFCAIMVNFSLYCIDLYEKAHGKKESGKNYEKQFEMFLVEKDSRYKRR
jgi:hypothetical protein